MTTTVTTTTEAGRHGEGGRATPLPRFPRSARTRILAWYIVLLAGSALATNVAVYRLLTSQRDAQVEESLRQEAEEMRSLVDGLNPASGQPFGEDIEAIFTTFLRRNLPVEGEALFTLVEALPIVRARYLRSTFSRTRRSCSGGPSWTRRNATP